MIPNDGISPAFSGSAQDQRQALENNAAFQALADTMLADIKIANEEIASRGRAVSVSDEGYDSIFASATRIYDLPHNNAEAAGKMTELDGFQTLKFICEKNNRNLDILRVPTPDGEDKFAAVVTYKTTILDAEDSLRIAMNRAPYGGLRVAA